MTNYNNNNNNNYNNNNNNNNNNKNNNNNNENNNNNNSNNNNNNKAISAILHNRKVSCKNEQSRTPKNEPMILLMPSATNSRFGEIVSPLSMAYVLATT